MNLGGMEVRYSNIPSPEDAKKIEKYLNWFNGVFHIEASGMVFAEPANADVDEIRLTPNKNFLKLIRSTIPENRDPEYKDYVGEIVAVSLKDGYKTFLEVVDPKGSKCKYILNLNNTK